MTRRHEKQKDRVKKASGLRNVTRRLTAGINLET